MSSFLSWRKKTSLSQSPAVERQQKQTSPEVKHFLYPYISAACYVHAIYCFEYFVINFEWAPTLHRVLGTRCLTQDEVDFWWARELLLESGIQRENAIKYDAFEGFVVPQEVGFRANVIRILWDHWESVKTNNLYQRSLASDLINPCMFLESNKIYY
jgi:hypothetical protein